MVIPTPMPTAAPVEMAAAMACGGAVVVCSDAVVAGASVVLVASEVVDVIGRVTVESPSAT